MVGVTSSKSGIVAKILVPIGKKVSVNEPIALMVENRAEYMEYLDATRCADHDAEGLAAAEKAVEDKKKKPDTKVLLREIKHLIQEGHIIEDSGKQKHYNLN
jgi:pyruvate/2-oxoglutarate dehydrogenase complex dihydrolipoamide acyltransferase (E2) component